MLTFQILSKAQREASEHIYSNVITYTRPGGCISGSFETISSSTHCSMDLAHVIAAVDGASYVTDDGFSVSVDGNDLHFVFDYGDDIVTYIGVSHQEGQQVLDQLLALVQTATSAPSKVIHVTMTAQYSR